MIHYLNRCLLSAHPVQGAVLAAGEIIKRQLQLSVCSQSSQGNRQLHTVGYSPEEVWEEVPRGEDGTHTWKIWSGFPGEVILKNAWELAGPGG